MFEQDRQSFQEELQAIREAGLFKHERILESPQSTRIVVGGREVLNFCANNYLGLANSDALKKAAKEGIDRWGFGLSSVRFICGTQQVHKVLEQKISSFHGTEDAILYSSCFDANGGLFETILGEGDAVISDALNHASIIDGIRLCKAVRYRYDHGDMAQLRNHLSAARSKGCRRVLIATDGVFSMDGSVAALDAICALAAEFGAMVMVDESHATGFFGPTGRGAAEHCGVLGKVDVITSTLGKALGGSAGGFTTGRREIIELLRQRSRPYLFSNTLTPAIAAASIACLDLLSASGDLRCRLTENTAEFRGRMKAAGFALKGEIHPIVPIMLGDAKLAVGMADALLAEGIYVIGFAFPVVPRGEARIRVQISAAHTADEIVRASEAFQRVGKAFGVVK